MSGKRSSKREPEVVTEIHRCSEITEDLLDEEYIAVDAEGVQLGRDGPLTLLQIAKRDGTVYLFDIQTNRNLFREGNLSGVLESNNIVKVIHASYNENTALYHQFKICLRNVFDTQIADHVIEMSKGHRLPNLLRLQQICEKYSKSAHVSEYKDIIRREMDKNVSDIWAKRPLSREQIHYASGDVLALIPEVYETQKRCIEETNSIKTFEEMMKDELLIGIDPSARVRKKQRMNKTINSIIEDITIKNYTLETDIADLDGDDLQALRRITFYDVREKPRLIQVLKDKVTMCHLQELEKELEEHGEIKSHRWKLDSFLRTVEKQPDPALKMKAEEIRKQVNNGLIENMSRKYNRGTTLTEVSEEEMDALRYIMPSGTTDSRFHRVVLRLYWLLMEEDLEDKKDIFDRTGPNFTMSKGYYKTIKYYTRAAKVPSSLKRKAEQFILNINQTFGKDVVPGSKSNNGTVK